MNTINVIINNVVVTFLCLVYVNSYTNNKDYTSPITTSSPITSTEIVICWVVRDCSHGMLVCDDVGVQMFSVYRGLKMDS